jgi:hypothetical protein
MPRCILKTAENMLFVLKPFKVITNMLSHSKLTSSRILACLAYLKTKGLKSKVEDTRDLVQMKHFMLACLDFYVKKYNMFDNILLITATYLDPELKDFEFVEELGEKSPSDFIHIALDYLLKKCSEINLGNLETLKNLDKAEKTNIKDSIEEELYLFCKPISSSSNKNKK